MLQFPKWKIILVLLVSLAGIVLAAPNMLPQSVDKNLPAWLQPVNLGLDLQGGSYLLLQVDGNYVIHEQMTDLVESVRTTLRDGHFRYLDLGVAGTDDVHVRIPDVKDRSRAYQALRKIDPDAVTTTGDNGMITLRYPQRVMADRLSQVVEQSLEIVRRRIDQLGTREPAIERESTDRIVVQLPGVKDPDRIKRLLGKTARLTFQMVDNSVSVAQAEQGHLPPGSELLPAADREPGLPNEYVVRRRVDVGGAMLTNAQATFDSTGQAVVNFKFNSEGARRFGDTTKDNVGRLLAIVLDGKVISAPRINEPILGGTGQISGNFTIQQAKDLALLLRAGALPAPLTILEQRTVGPDLGADSIHAGEMASIIGLVTVVVFMVLVYGILGLLADVALVLNLVLLLALLSLLDATLTLPGIAGIVLTMGMAVDANVLIYERIREELRAGRSIVSAVHAGFERAFSTIMDANITTLVAAILLFHFGSGPIRGFGVTLILGLSSSMFTAIMVTRLMVSTWIRFRRPKTLPL